MKVVSNASPLVNLSRIGRISILKDLYGQIIIPEALHREVVVAGRGMPGAIEVSEAEWIVTENVSNFQHVHVLRYDLDAGEAESIVLAIEKNAGLLIMDERIGREMARYLGLTYIGTIGALVEAKRRGIIDRVFPVLEELRDKAGFRVSEALFNYVLNLANEKQ
jgi:uncharacterized protein